MPTNFHKMKPKDLEKHLDNELGASESTIAIINTILISKTNRQLVSATWVLAVILTRQFNREKTIKHMQSLGV